MSEMNFKIDLEKQNRNPIISQSQSQFMGKSLSKNIKLLFYFLANLESSNKVNLNSNSLFNFQVS